MSAFSMSFFFVVFSLFLILSRAIANQTPTIGLAISPSAAAVHQPAHQQFVLTCRGIGAEPNLFSDLKWFDPRQQEVTPTYSERINPDISATAQTDNSGRLLLHFANPTADNSGQYRCSATFQHSDSFSATLNLTFFHDVTWEDCPPIQTLVLGAKSENRIRCAAKANPKPTLIWTKDGSTLETRKRFEIDSTGLSIESVESRDGGVYRVRALVAETGRLHDTFITVQILEPPKIEFLDPMTSVIESQDATIRCSSRGTPPPLYTWFDSHKRNLSSLGGFSVDRNSGTLLATNFRSENSGLFSCFAENAAGSDEKTTLVRVLRRPRVSHFANSSVDQNSEAVIRCHVLGDPKPQLSIRRDGDSRSLATGDPRVSLSVLSGDLIDEQILELRLNPITRKDDGLYFCRGHNDAGIAEMAAHLEVRFAPDMSRTPLTSVKHWDRNPVNITCIADAIPNATIRWFFRGQQILQNSIYSFVNSESGISRLVVDPRAASQRDIYGVYRCEGVNSLGESEIMVGLEEAFRPGIISAVNHESVFPTSITFRLVAPSFDGGMSINAIHAHFRRDDSDFPQWTTHRWPLDRSERYFISGLRPRTRYVFRFSAENAVGIGDFSPERVLATAPESPPDRPLFANTGPANGVIESSFGGEMSLSWSLPADNGKPIRYFEIQWFGVRPTDGDFERINQDIHSASVSTSDTSSTSYTIRGLKPNSFYRTEIRAQNELGFSDSSSLIFRTADVSHDVSDDTPDDESPISVSLIAGISLALIIILLITMDIVFCIRLRVGISYFLLNQICISGRKPFENRAEDTLHAPFMASSRGSARTRDSAV
ncbi:fasciclin-2-like isoform X2 [Oppia nitens]|uniref:fasciclin-2-like isoform X2 n=1 Tax=Oppia nitens TaxID=1686743 RepID=UPI0023DA14AA|nr:fasciclin-2-like isoform X2 [Oppia nitens]